MCPPLCLFSPLRCGWQWPHSLLQGGSWLAQAKQQILFPQERESEKDCQDLWGLEEDPLSPSWGEVWGCEIGNGESKCMTPRQESTAAKEATASRLKMEPTPARANQREGEGPGCGRHHLGHRRKSDLASTLPLGSSVPCFFIRFLATCHRVSPNYQFFEGKLEIQGIWPQNMAETPVVQTGGPAWIPYVPQLWAHDISLFLWHFCCYYSWASLSFQDKMKRKGDNPTRRCALGRQLWALLSAPGPRGALGTDAPALISYTGKGLWRWKSLNISILILLNLGTCYYIYKIKNQ